MVLHVCFSSHFYILVAVLDTKQPVMFVLESIGGLFANIPPLADSFCKFLHMVCPNPNHFSSFDKEIVDVPRQRAGFNNCGLFALYYVEMILKDPASFEEKARRNNLADWFPPSLVDTKRKELAAHIGQLAVDQRQSGGVMMEQYQLDFPLSEPRVYHDQVIIGISYNTTHEFKFYY